MTDALSAWVPALATALLHFLWQGAVLGLLAWLALGLLRNARAQARYAVACLALALCAALPACNLAQALSADDAGWQAIPLMAASGAPGTLASPLQAAVAFDLPALPALQEDATTWIVALWAFGAALLSLRMALGAWWIHDLRRNALPASGPWQACVDRLAPCFGISRSVVVRLVGAGDTPMATGFWRPMVLLPAAVVARLPADLLEALLAHELAHIRRHDYLVNLLQGAIETLLFYHPVVWWLSQRLRIERELVADDLAARATGQPRQLAVALSELDRLSAPRPALPHAHYALAAHGGHLMSRIRQLVKPERRAIGAAVLLPVIGLASIGAAFYAQARLVDADAVARPEAAATASLPVALETSGVTGLPVNTSTRAQVSTADGATRVAANDRADGYALIRSGREGFLMSGNTRDVDGIHAVRRLIDGDFVWFQRDGKAWIVRDAATLARVQAATRDADAISAEMAALSERMHPHSERMEDLSGQMEVLQQSMDAAESPAMQAASARMETLSKQMWALIEQDQALLHPMLDARGDAAREREINEQRADLRLEQARVQRDMDRERAVMQELSQRMEARAAPMEALGREMEAAGRPMEQIGKEMEAVGKRLERETNATDAEIRRIIDDAYARGLATPAPSTH